MFSILKEKRKAFPIQLATVVSITSQKPPEGKKKADVNEELNE